VELHSQAAYLVEGDQRTEIITRSTDAHGRKLGGGRGVLAQIFYTQMQNRADDIQLFSERTHTSPLSSPPP